MANAGYLLSRTRALSPRTSRTGSGTSATTCPRSSPTATGPSRRSAELHPDLVLMDIFLKGDMDGIQAAEQIRTRYDIPVIFLTAFADPRTLQRAKVTEPFGYILKPFEERELLTAIEMALYKHGMEKKLKDSERWLSTTLKSIDDAIIATDTTGQDHAHEPGRRGAHRVEGSRIPRPGTSPASSASWTRRQASRCPALAGQQSQATLVARNGIRLVVECSATPIRDDKSNVTRCRARVPGHHRAPPDRRGAAVHPVLRRQGWRRGVLDSRRTGASTT